jgi:hypothetical protein
MTSAITSLTSSTALSTTSQDKSTTDVKLAKQIQRLMPDLFQEIATALPLQVRQLAPLITQYAQPIRGIGAAEWEQLGLQTEQLPLPLDFLKLCTQTDPMIKNGSTIGQNYLLILMPKGLTINKLIELLKNRVPKPSWHDLPLLGEPRNRTSSGFTYTIPPIPYDLDLNAPEESSYWFLARREPIRIAVHSNEARELVEGTLYRKPRIHEALIMAISRDLGCFDLDMYWKGICCDPAYYQYPLHVSSVFGRRLFIENCAGYRMSSCEGLGVVRKLTKQYECTPSAPEPKATAPSEPKELPVPADSVDESCNIS